MDIRKLFTATNQALNDIVIIINDDDLNLDVPQHMAYSDGQTLRTTLNILAYENACVPRMLAGEKDIPSNDKLTDDYLQNDFVSRYAELTASANAAAESCDLDKTVYMSYATVPANQYLNDIIIQRSTAAFDIAQLAGITFQWPEELVQGIWDITEPNAPMLREYGVFPPEVNIAPTATTQDKLIALTGRQP